METPFKAYDGNEPCIFVSYSHSDRDAVFKCLAHLHSRGFRIWYDEGIEPGASWYEVLAERIASAACVLLFMSSETQRSAYISKEITCAIAKGKHLVCVVLDGCEVQGAFELMLCDTQMMSRSDGEFYEKLEKALRPELTCEGYAGPVPSSGSSGTSVAGGAKKRAPGRWKAWTAAAVLACGVAVGVAGFHAAGVFDSGEQEAPVQSPEAQEAAAFLADEKKALAGDADAQCALGARYGEGRGVAQDYAKAKAWWEKALAGGSTEAMYRLAGLYRE
nr:TIR domain-containing protein [Desulfovibrio sp.]